MKTIIRFLKPINKATGVLLNHFNGFLIFTIFAIVLYTILCRYVFNINTGGIDEFTVYCMTSSVWVGAVLVSRNYSEGQIKIDLLRTYVKNETVMAVFDSIWQIIGIIVMAMYTNLSFKYFIYQLKRGSVLSGVNFPIWVFTGIMTLCSALIAIYELSYIVHLINSRLLSKRREG
ncbi:TRAP transporter small permease subunit [Alkalibaculum sp. M08DMB]|uniref:TRAP transporter small permease subunit n=1 Tax=Alkalibaculum sporogenes TaxID=2655001 RepID=A0A6A7K8X9_9FIRM|nr:TRAP transporter small permease [Alkalibaculum sporogenes]MPW25647.1 TRAP transporter small permease subunit [Alkalibaculum sporogenes]